jgi:hypothetical protein
MALADDLRAYFRAYGHVGPPLFSGKKIVIVGEVHDVTAPRYPASIAVLRQIFRDGRFKFFANESFLNATTIRTAVRDNWQHGVIPPPYNPATSPNTRYELARPVVVSAFDPLLHDLKTKHCYILHIGSRVRGHKARDESLAQHFLDEIHDRRLSTHSHGVMLMGGAHAAAVPFFTDSSLTVRMRLERKLFHCVTMLLLTDYVGRNGPDDLVTRTNGAESVRLSTVTGNDPISVGTHHPNSPFRHVTLSGSDSNYSMASQYEYVMVRKL